MRLNRIKRRGLIIGAVLIAEVIILIVVLSRFFESRSRKAAEEAAQLQNGRAYLVSLESRDLDGIRDQVQTIFHAQQEAAWQKMKQQLVDGEIDVWSFLGDSVIMGDSRAVGFSVYGYMPEYRVMAGAGYTIRNIADYEEDLVQVNPSEVFLCFGINDHSIGFWTTAEDYAAEYMDILDELQALLPDTKFFVVSTLPANATGIAEESSWATIPEWNDVLEEYCADRGYGFVDCSSLMDEYSEYYDLDGIHLQTYVYPYWAADMVMTAYEQE